jgi:decaprenylphospho-beta-D-erythro-pentofuranosid-2-ulose 2-reductase
MKVLIIGATSAIAHETAKWFAKEGAEFFLIARSEEKLAAVADDLAVRGAQRSETFVLDANDFARHQEMFDQAVSSLGGLDVLLVAHGALGDQERLERNVEETLQNFSTNCTSVISLLTIAANYFEGQKRGCIAVISSVAGDRGRKSNYIYGTAKAALNAFTQGLRNRLSASGVTVLTIKPGFVSTPMTSHLKRGLLFADPRSIGKGIYEAIKQHKDIVYLPWFWRLIMLVICNIPERIFKHLSLG